MISENAELEPLFVQNLCQSNEELFRMVESDSTSYFKTSKSHGNYSKQ